jgi:hypothetical protein
VRQSLTLILLLAAGSAQAAPVTWTIDSLLFDDGGTGTGTFVYDANTNIYSDISIVTTAGSVLGGSVYSFINPGPLSPPSASGVALVSSDLADLTGLPAIGIGFAAALTNTGGLISIDAGIEGTCVNAGCDAPNAFPVRNILSGQLSAIPVPAAVWLFASALGLLGWLRR